MAEALIALAAAAQRRPELRIKRHEEGGSNETHEVGRASIPGWCMIPASYANFLLGSSSASAALIGLLFVSVSIEPVDRSHRRHPRHPQRETWLAAPDAEKTDAAGPGNTGRRSEER